MRSKVAAHYGGHPFEKRYLDLDPIRLAVLYRQVLTDEEEKRTWTLNMTKTLNDSWSNKFKNWFEILQIFTNPKLFVALEKEKEMEKYREEISADNFAEEWDKMMQVIPQEVTVDESKAGQELKIPTVDKETEKLIVGWVQNHSGS